MTYDRFEKLPVRNAAVELAVGIDQLVQNRALRAKGDLANQLERATLSISNNIAEGFERGKTSKLIFFIYVARGSAGEVRSALQVASRLTGTESLKPQIDRLLPQCESISRQLRGWADSLQNTDIKGQRHLNDQSRAEWEQGPRREAFMKYLATFRKPLTTSEDEGNDLKSEI